MVEVQGIHYVQTVEQLRVLQVIHEMMFQATVDGVFVL